MEEILSFLHPQHSLRLSSFERSEWGNGSNPKPSIEEPPKLELKLLASSLKYVFHNPSSHLLFQL